MYGNGSNHTADTNGIGGTLADEAKSAHIQNNETDTVITEYRYSADSAFQYPSQMRISGIKNADGEEDSYTYGYTYDSYGNLTEVVNPDKSKVSYTYDKLNRKTGEILEDGSTRTTTYDDSKNTLLTTNANEYSLLCFYDKYGKLISVYDKLQSCHLTKKETFDNWFGILKGFFSLKRPPISY